MPKTDQPEPSHNHHLTRGAAQQEVSFLQACAKHFRTASTYSDSSPVLKTGHNGTVTEAQLLDYLRRFFTVSIGTTRTTAFNDRGCSHTACSQRAMHRGRKAIPTSMLCLLDLWSVFRIHAEGRVNKPIKYLRKPL